MEIVSTKAYRYEFLTEGYSFREKNVQVYTCFFYKCDNLNALFLKVIL